VRQKDLAENKVGTYRLGAIRGKAKARTLRRTITAAMALAAYFW